MSWGPLFSNYPVDQQAAAQQVVNQQAAADAALQEATFQCDQTIMGRDFEYNGYVQFAKKIIKR